MMLWVRNLGSDPLPYAWNITLEDGQALPANWTVAFSPASGELQPAGTKTQTGRRTDYPDWAYTVATLQVPADAEGAFAAELRVGGTVVPFEFRVDDERRRVSGPGDSVTVRYDGRFQDTQERFDEGSFPTRLGSGQTVPGFDNGLMGLTLGEQARLVIPPAFAYGYDNPPGNYQQFNGRTLQFDVEITRFA